MGVFSGDENTKSENIKRLLNNEEVSNFADEIIEIKGNYIDFLDELKPDIVVKGLEHSELLDPLEMNLLNSYGAKVYFNSGIPLKEDQMYAHGLEGNTNFTTQLNDFKIRNLDTKNLINYINKFSSLKVLVVGDVIVDSYVNCSPLGMSREDHSLVYSPHDEARFIGGASIVSAHLSSLGADVEFCSITCNDQEYLWSISELRKHNVSVNVFHDHAKRLCKNSFPVKK